MIDDAPRRGLIFVLVGPSAVGKNAIMQDALKQVGNLRQLPTATTREKRHTEQEGREHFFQTEDSFVKLIEENALLEWQWVHGHRYGMLRQTVEDAIADTTDHVADIDVLGAAILKHRYPENSVLVFVCPPDARVLEQRIRDRAEETEEEISRRLQRVPFEMKFAAMCDYLIVNDSLSQAVDEFIGIVRAERSRRNAHSTRVTALFCHRDQALVRAGTETELPNTHILRNEKAETALSRLAASVGIAAYQIARQPQAPSDGLAPSHYVVCRQDTTAQVNLIFSCTVLDPVGSPPTGWEWKPLSALNPDAFCR